MPRVTRHNLGGGILGKPLHTRSDIEAYHKGNFQQSNFLATPYGGIVRRQPATWLGYIRSNADGSAPSVVRGLGSIISQDTKYSVIMVAYEGGGSGFQIFGADGAYKTSATSPYQAEHIFEVDVSQINDVMFFTHIDYPPQRLIRSSDTDWSLSEMDFTGFPFLDENTDRDMTISTGLSAWQPEIEYEVPDRVLPEPTVSMQANWIGTAISHQQESTISAEYDFSTEDAYVPDGHTVRYSSEGFFRGVQETEQPYLVIRIEDPVDPAEIEGATIYASCSFIETDTDDDTDEEYSVSGVIHKVIDLTTHHYLMVDAGLSSYFEYLTDDPASLNLEVASSTFASVPVPKVPDSAELEYDASNFRTYNYYDSGTIVAIRYARYVADRRRRHQFLFGTANHGGAFVVASSNVVLGDETKWYEANASSQNIQPPATEWDETTGNLPLESNVVEITTKGFAPFTQADVGRVVTAVNELSGSDSGTFTALDDESAYYSTTGTVSLKTEDGVWEGTLVLESRPLGTSDEYWETIGSIVSTGDYNGSITRYLPYIGTEIRVRMEAIAGGSECKWALEMDGGDNPIYKILKVLTENTAIARVISGSNSLSVSTFRWSLGAFGGNQGYPAVHTVHEERLYYASTYGRPFQLWGSEVNNWENFQLGTFETSPISFRLLSDNVTRIKWLLSRSSQLYIGTDFGEYTATTPDIDSVLSALNPPRINLVTPYGSAAQQAIAVHDEVAHVVGDELTIRALAQKEYTTTETSKSLTIFDPDIAESGIKEMHLQRNPYAVIWAVRNDGKLAALTYDIENDVMGWAEIELEGADFQSHWIMPNDAGIDEVYFVDKRDDLAVIASGATLPTEVNGEYFADGSAPSFGTGLTLTDSRDTRALWNGLFNRVQTDVFEHVNGEYDLYNDGLGEWRVTEISSGDLILAVDGDKQLPPFTGWAPDAGGPVATIAYSFEYVNGSYGFTQGIDGNYYLFDGYADRNALFSRSGSIWGDYAPLGISEGTLSVGQVAFNLEKFEYVAATATQQNVDLNESTYTSLVEFSSMVQGPKSLERTVVRATRVVVYLVNSQGGEVSADGGETWEPIIYPDTELYTGHIDVRVNSGNVEDLRVLVRAVGSDPFHLIGVSVDIEEQGTEVS